MLSCTMTRRARAACSMFVLFQRNSRKIWIGWLWMHIRWQKLSAFTKRTAPMPSRQHLKAGSWKASGEFFSEDLCLNPSVFASILLRRKSTMCWFSLRSLSSLVRVSSLRKQQSVCWPKDNLRKPDCESCSMQEKMRVLVKGALILLYLFAFVSINF